MKRFIAPLAVIVLAGIAPLAQATIQITYSGSISGSCSIGTGPPGLNTSTCADVTTGVLQFTGLSAFANLFGDPSLGIETHSDTSLFNNSGGDQTIKIRVVGSDFLLPVTPPGPSLEFRNHVSTTTAVGATTSKFSFTGCVDTSNVAPGCPGTPGVYPYVIVPLTPNIAPVGSTQTDAPVQIISSLGSPYAIDEEIDITLGAHGYITFSGSSTLTPVPEPMSIALLGGVVLLTSRLIRRKRSEVS
jgi:hypothetical protein